jgi:DNA-binding MarR family transcriptional regulator
MGDFGITPTQFAALAKLDELGAVSQNQLGRLIAMDPATISGVVSRLTARKFVRQAPDASDGRLVMLTLTAAGRNAVAAMKAGAAEVSRRTLARLSDDEKAQLLKTISKIC